MDNSFRHIVNSERLFVKDSDGYVEATDHDMVWDNPQLYRWLNGSIDGNVMLYFFEFMG